MNRIALALLPFAFACAPAAELHTFTSGADGFDTSTYWLDTGEQVVVFDAQFTPALAEAMLAEIRSTTDSPIGYVVLTHPNPDKFNGATVFQAEGAQLVASNATADAMPGVHAYKQAYFVGAGMFTAESYPSLPEVDLRFSGELELDGAQVRLVELDNSGVSSTQTVAVLPDAVVTGDLFANRAHAWLEGGIVDGAPTPDLAAWHAALDELAPIVGEEATVYPGRGVTLPLAQAVAEQHAYLDTADAVVTAYVQGLVEPTNELSGANAGAHYAAMADQLSAEFPAYQFSYLVNYGVYGLAMQRASE